MICCEREACSCCGCDTWAEAHFVAGVLVCAACWREIRRPSRQSTGAVNARQRAACAAGTGFRRPDGEVEAPGNRMTDLHPVAVDSQFRDDDTKATVEPSWFVWSVS
jgi:hypothetical protein